MMLNTSKVFLASLQNGRPWKRNVRVLVPSYYLNDLRTPSGVPDILAPEGVYETGFALRIVELSFNSSARITNPTDMSRWIIDAQIVDGGF